MFFTMMQAVASKNTETFSVKNYWRSIAHSRDDCKEDRFLEKRATG